MTPVYPGHPSTLFYLYLTTGSVPSCCPTSREAVECLIDSVLPFNTACREADRIWRSYKGGLSDHRYQEGLRQANGLLAEYEKVFSGPRPNRPIRTGLENIVIRDLTKEEAGKARQAMADADRLSPYKEFKL